jgi:hypothetical protein
VEWELQHKSCRGAAMKACLLTICFCAMAVGSVLAQDRENATVATIAHGKGPPSEGSVNSTKLIPVSYAAHRSDDFSSQVSNSAVDQQEVTETVPDSVSDKLPTTMTVSTATLLELHFMRKSAVDLCIQLPTKYRTRLPECSDIFKHEIRLEALAKDKK